MIGENKILQLFLNLIHIQLINDSKNVHYKIFYPNTILIFSVTIYVLTLSPVVKR